jgi:hypothetical protein
MAWLKMFKGGTFAVSREVTVRVTAPERSIVTISLPTPNVPEK